jgi:mono/diheme cytochrome c family protein/glucose/arabinose dehydrogenase
VKVLSKEWGGINLYDSFMKSLLLAATSVLMALLWSSEGGAEAPDPVRVLIIDGRNNHDWISTTESLRATLHATGRFEVSVSTAPDSGLPEAPRRPRGDDPKVLAAFEEAQKRYKALPKNESAWSQWQIDFSQYDTVILNYNGPRWPKAIEEGFTKFVREGGGVLVIHAANNCFTDWPEYNEMIGLGWRKPGFGKMVTVDPETGKAVESGSDQGTGHGAKHPFKVTVRAPEHPVMKGLPKVWLHAKDELYHRLRGSAQNLTVLSSAYSDPKTGGSGNHEPITHEQTFGKGRVIVTTMGHFWPGDVDRKSLHCLGFQTIVARAAEYLATGKVTLPVPEGFPAEDEEKIVPPHQLGSSQAIPATDWRKVKEENEFHPLTVLQALDAFELAPGFQIENVAAEPDVEEPVLAVWDGNGAMYVAEMRSYMQDVEGNGTKTLKNGRVKRLEDTNGDGRYDRVTVFADGLNLPRMILPLDDRIAIVETDTTSVYSFRDTDGDGVSDEKELLWKGKEIPPTKSVEHQDSGLIWNLDNTIYVSYNHTKYRFTDGTWRGLNAQNIWAQWGLDHDETGQIFYSSNSDPFFSSQMPREYWGLIDHRGGPRPRDSEPVAFGAAYDLSFLEVKNLCPTKDRGGANTARRGMTSAGGQSVYKANKLPVGYLKSFFITDPTAHVVRQGLVTDRDGQRFLIHPHGQEEFLISPDIYFRPVNTHIGPDGAIYVVDMARGIIQDAPWLSPGPREFIRGAGLDKVIRRGRIWRVSHQDHPLAFEKPRMLEERTASLVRHLDHPNSWWRMTAQKLIILREDRDLVIPLLKDQIQYTQNALGRLHALWTLHGMGAEKEILPVALKDRDWRVRAAAVRMHEPMIKEGNHSALLPLVDDKHPEVAKQLILSLGWSKDPAVFDLIGRAIENHPAHLGVTLAGTVALWKQETASVKRLRSGEAFKTLKDSATTATRWKQALAQWNRGLTLPEEMPKDDTRKIQGGEVLYFQNCVSCHGPDGKGTKIPGMKTALAPSLADSKRVHGPLAGLMPVMANGLIGPIDGVTYQANYMAPAHALGITRDDRLAELLSYLRYAWGGNPTLIKPDEVKEWRRKLKERTTPWTDEELKEKLRQEKGMIELPQK